MKRVFGHFLLTIFLASAVPVPAGEQPSFVEQRRCWLGSVSYSPGATARAGNAVMVCTADFTWSPTEAWASGCIHAGRFYAPGDLKRDFVQQEEATRCLLDGTWDVLLDERD